MSGEKIYKASSRKELAAMAGCSVRTLVDWLISHPKISAEFKKAGLRVNYKMLPPNLVKLICEEFGIEYKPNGGKKAGEG